MSWWKIIKNRRNIKIPKRRDTKEVPKYAYSRPAIKTKEQIQADQEKLKQKGERQKQINDYIKSIEYFKNNSSMKLKKFIEVLELYFKDIGIARAEWEKLERDNKIDYSDERILSIENRLTQLHENSNKFIVQNILDFNRLVRAFLKEEERRNKKGYATTQAGLEHRIGLDGDDKQRIEKAFVDVKKNLLENYKQYDEYVAILKQDNKEDYDEYQKLKNKLR